MVHPILSHTTYIAVGMIAIMMIIATVYGMQADVSKVDKTSKINYIALEIENKIIELNAISSDNFEAQIQIPFSEKYLVEISGNILTVSGDGNEVTRTISVQGSGQGYTPIYLKFDNDEVTVSETASMGGINPPHNPNVIT